MKKWLLMGFLFSNLCVASSNALSIGNVRPPSNAAECMQACSPAKCRSISIKNTCYKDCNALIDLRPCLNTKAEIRNGTDANTAAGLKKNIFTDQLVKKAPSAAYYLNSGNAREKEGNSFPTAQDYKDVIHVTENLRGMCAQTLQQQEKIGGLDDKTASQFKSIINNIDTIIGSIKQSAPLLASGPSGPINGEIKKKLPQGQPLPGMVPDWQVKKAQTRKTNEELKRLVGDAELLVKNCVQQGGTLIYKLKQSSNYKVKKVAENIASPSRCAVCLTNKCSTDLKTYKKCKETCPSIFTKKCLTAVENNPAMQKAYQEHYNTQQFN